MRTDPSFFTTRRVAGALMLIAGILPLICLPLLSIVFGYPDIIRAEPSVLLTKLHETRAITPLLYYAGIGGMGFFLSIGSALLSEHLSAFGPSPWNRLVGTAGTVSGVILFAGILRYARLFPELAAWRVSGTYDPAAVDLVFEALNSYLGETLAEHVQFVFTTLFMVSAGFAGLRTRAFPRILAWAAFPVAFVVFVGNLEFFGVPGTFAWNRIAAELWIVWSVAVGGCLLFLRGPEPRV
jgi:hypothetical protein